jgi:4-hydroxythreonine-4-phosphate dehydrogenase
MTLPRIGVSLGDPGGIGPEIVAKSFTRGEAFPPAQYFLCGSARVLEREAEELGLRPFWKAGEADRRETGPGVWLKDFGLPKAPERRGAPSAENGRASFVFFEEAVASARRGDLDAVVTAPVSKTSWNLAGIGFRGHTEYLENIYPDAVMTFWSERLTVALLSHHRPLAEAVRQVTRENLLRLFRVLRDELDRFRSGAYEFLVAGLNPHAGEDGLLGTEERCEIEPAVVEARRAGMNIRGPLPPDLVFREALDRPERVVVALTHDQGLIPFKLTSFETGVNVTLGLPFVRTSPDHGTAFDIAGKNIADPGSFREAVKLAAALVAGVL